MAIHAMLLLSILYILIELQDPFTLVVLHAVEGTVKNRFALIVNDSLVKATTDSIKVGIESDGVSLGKTV